jgi:hypothetical protein
MLNDKFSIQTHPFGCGFAALGYPCFHCFGCGFAALGELTSNPCLVGFALQQIAILTAPLGPPLVPDWLLREGDRWENPWKFLLGVRDLFFPICIFVNHRLSGVVDFPAPGDPMLSSHTEESTNMRLCGTDPCRDPTIRVVRAIRGKIFSEMNDLHLLSHTRQGSIKGRAGVKPGKRNSEYNPEFLA